MNSQKYQPIQVNTLPLWEKVIAHAWICVNATLYRYSLCFCRGWRRLLLRLFGADIHPTSSPGRFARIEFPWNVKLGAYSSLGANSWIFARTRIVIGDKTCISEGVKLVAGTHDITDYHFKLVTAPIVVGSYCWIATSATLLPGVVVGDGVVVGACAVVAKSVAPWSVVVGNPARIIKKREFREIESNNTIGSTL